MKAPISSITIFYTIKHCLYEAVASSLSVIANGETKRYVRVVVERIFW